MNTTIRIMIVDNDSLRAEEMTQVLKKHNDLEVASIVSSRELAIKQLSSDLDIVILNPSVLKQHTLSRFIQSVNTKAKKARVILNMKEDALDEELISNIKTGIRGYIRPTDPPAILPKVVRAVHSGEIWAERRILEKALSKPMILPETLKNHIPGLPPLTNREMEMLTMLLQGATNKEIALKSSISERTVKTHLYRIYKKLNVKSRTKAIALLAQS